MNKNTKLILFVAIPIALLLIVVSLFSIFNKKKVDEIVEIEFLNVNTAWADSMILQMSLEEKIGQLVLLSKEEGFATNDSIQLLINQYNIGGAVFAEKNLEKHIEMINNIQTQNKIPLFVGVDTDNHSLNFLSDIIQFPSQKSVLSIKDDSLQVGYAKLIAEQNSKLGVNLNFINLTNYIADTTELDTAIINFYGKKISLYANYLQKKDIFPCVEIIDLHKDTTKNVEKNQIYKHLFKKGLPSIVFKENERDIIFDGLVFKEYQKEEDISLFFENNYDVLILNNNYNELISNLVDAVKSKKKYTKILNTKVKKILLAKTWLKLNDYKKIDMDSVLSFSNSLDKMLLSRELFQKSITILNNKNDFLPIKNLTNDFQAILLGEKEYKTFQTSLNYYKDIFAIHLNPEVDNVDLRLKIYGEKTGIISINDYPLNDKLLSILTEINKKQKLIIVNFKNIANLEKLKDFPYLVHIWDTTQIEQDFSAQLLFGGIEAVGKLPISIGDYFKFNTGFTTKKTRLKYTIPEEVGIDSEKLSKIDSIINYGISRGATPGCQVFVAKNGCVIVNKGYGFHTYSKSNRVKSTDIYDVASVTKIAATTMSAMKMLEQGKLSLDKEIGEYFDDTHIEYTRIKPDTILNIDTLNLNDVKDIKKILRHQDTLHINDSIIVAYDTLIITATPRLNIFKVTARDLLRHESGVIPAMPILKYLLWRQEYYKYVEHFNSQKNKFNQDSIKKDSTIIDSVKHEVVVQDSLSRDSVKTNTNIILQTLLTKSQFRDRIYSNSYKKDSSEVEIAQAMFLNKRYNDTLWLDTRQLRVYSRKIYQYSDVNMILLQQVIDSINDTNMDEYTRKTFYKPLGLQTTTYKPLDHFNKSKIVPTEVDNFWRQQLIHGHVHDPSAALIGGISGNAGVFSSAHDMGVLFQMLLNGGVYGGSKFLGNSTIDLFSRTQSDSYRGLGFDKWSKRQIIAKDASPNSYGHTGFTGCCVWIDPDNEIVYVFLSNRVHPSAKNWKLNSYKIRNNVHQAVYDAMF